MYVDGAQFDVAIMPPNRIKQLAARLGAAWPFHEMAQQTEFCWTKRDLRAATPHPNSDRIKLQIADHQSTTGYSGASAPQYSLYPRAQFAGATLPLEEAVLVRWKQLLAELKARNRTIACEDSLIAATALHYHHTILTGNTAHFAPTGASVLNPME